MMDWKTKKNIEQKKKQKSEMKLCISTSMHTSNENSFDSNFLFIYAFALYQSEKNMHESEFSVHNYQIGRFVHTNNNTNK